MQQDQLLAVTLEESVLHYAQCTEKAGLAGVVCSALEAKNIHQATSDTFMCLTPGIRPSGTEVGDQKRVVTPALAKEIGSNAIVVGRPITQVSQPYETYLAIKNEWNRVV